jgi:hypothetical protein
MSFLGSRKLQERAVNWRSESRRVFSWVPRLPRFQGDWTRNGKKTS